MAIAQVYSPTLDLLGTGLANNILMGEMTAAHLTRGRRDLARTAHQLNDV